MSFISIIKKIGNAVAGVERVASPIISAVVPGAAPILAMLDPIFLKLQTAITTVEVNQPGMAGPDKAGAVAADFEAGLEVAQGIAEAMGQTVTYDKAELQNAINLQVAAFNSMAKVKASLKMVPKA